MQINGATWYGLCAVVGAASAWLGGSFGSLVLILVLVVSGLILAFAGERSGSLPFHHALIGLAVSLAFANALPLVFFAIRSGS